MEKMTFTWNPIGENNKGISDIEELKACISSIIDVYSMLSVILDKDIAKKVILKKIDEIAMKVRE